MVCEQVVISWSSLYYMINLYIVQKNKNKKGMHDVIMWKEWVHRSKYNKTIEMSLYHIIIMLFNNITHSCL